MKKYSIKRMSLFNLVGFLFFLLLKVGRALFSQAISKQMDDGNADDFHFVKKNI